uniref:Uncharacterized protein n=1 Tax=Populus trichocarpa TaxID=3694 RepID=A0A3N7F009_POPTR
MILTATTISSIAHGFGLPLQSSLTAARRQRSPAADPVFTPSLSHLQQQQPFSHHHQRLFTVSSFCLHHHHCSS